MWIGLSRANCRRSGMTLVELLIALVIAAFVIIAASNLSIMGSKMESEQESIELIQNEAQLAMYHMAGRLQTAYFLRLESPTDIRIQRVRPEALGEPPDPDALLLAASFRHERYHLDAVTNQIIYEDNIHPVTLAPLPGYKKMVLASYVESLVMAQPVGEPNICEVTLTIRHPRSGERHTLGPMRIASREMSVEPPVGWEPPLP